MSEISRFYGIIIRMFYNAILRTVLVGKVKALCKYAYSQAFPERASRRKVKSILDPYLSYLEQRRLEGCENALQLWRELCQQGFTGTHKQVSRWMQQHRSQPALGRPASSSLSEKLLPQVVPHYYQRASFPDCLYVLPLKCRKRIN